MSTFRPSKTEVSSLKISDKVSATGTSSSVMAAALDDTNSFDGARAGQVTVTMDTGHTVGAGNSIIVTVVADETTTSDIVVASSVAQSAGIPMSTSVTETATGEFKVGVTNNHPTDPFAEGSTFTFNWLIM